MPEDIEYRYSPDRTVSLIGIIMSSIGVFAFWPTKFDKNEPVNMIELLGYNIPISSWVYLVFFISILLISFVGLLEGINNRKIKVSSNFFTIPKTLFNPEEKIVYTDIKDIKTVSNIGGTSIYFKTEMDTHTIIASNFKSKKEFTNTLNVIHYKTNIKKETL